MLPVARAAAELKSENGMGTRLCKSPKPTKFIELFQYIILILIVQIGYLFAIRMAIHFRVHRFEIY